MGTGKLLGKPYKLQGNDLRWTSIPSRGCRNTPNRFMLQKLGLSSGSHDLVGSKASFFFLPGLAWEKYDFDLLLERAKTPLITFKCLIEIFLYLFRDAYK